MVAPISEMLETAREAAQVACNGILRPKWTDATDREHLERALDEILSDLDAARDDNPRVYRPGLHLHDTAGFVRVAFRLAFWHLVHTSSWRDAVVDVASRGGDADTNAAIVGALLGARDGANAIPADWRERVLGVRQPGPADWAAAHHPKHLLVLVK
jgi:ADP-ribosylglycohydrolase